MRDAWRMFRVQLRDMSGWNRAFYCADRAKRPGKVALLLFIYFAMVSCLPAAGMYAYLLISGLNAAGMLTSFHEIVFSAITTLSLVLAVLKANGTLVGFKDYDMLSALPVSAKSLAASRMLLVYAYDLLGILIFLLPSCAVYAYFAKPTTVFYVIWVAMLPFLALVPMCAGSALGLLMSRMMSGMRGKQYASMALLMLLSFGILWLSMGDESVMQGRVVSAGQGIGGVFATAYPLTRWYGLALNEGSIPAAVGFIAVSLAVTYVFLFLYARNLKRLQARVSSSPTRKRLKSVDVDSSGALRALYGKELRRYFASAIYVFNTCFGVLMLIAGAVALTIKGKDVIATLIDLPEVSGILAPGSALLIGMIMATINTTGSSVSLEGKQIWILKTIPVAGWRMLLAKALVCLTLAAPASLIGSTACVAALRPEAGMAIWIYLFPLGVAGLIALFGLWFNLRSYRFDWPNETVIVKQSMGAGIPMLVGMAFVGACGALLYTVGEGVVWPLLVACYGADAALAISLYRHADERILALKA